MFNLKNIFLLHIIFGIGIFLVMSSAYAEQIKSRSGTNLISVDGKIEEWSTESKVTQKIQTFHDKGKITITSYTSIINNRLGLAFEIGPADFRMTPQTTYFVKIFIDRNGDDVMTENYDLELYQVHNEPKNMWIKYYEGDLKYQKQVSMKRGWDGDSLNYEIILPELFMNTSIISSDYKPKIGSLITVSYQYASVEFPDNSVSWSVYENSYYGGTSYNINNILPIPNNFMVISQSGNNFHTNNIFSNPIQTGNNELNGGGCLIATATYGSEMASQIQQLREIRDNKLLQTKSGTYFINLFNDFYYLFSPTISDYEREYPIFKEIVKLGLTPIISTFSILNYVEMDSEFDVLVYGISLILLNIAIYVGIPFTLFIVVRNQFSKK